MPADPLHTARPFPLVWKEKLWMRRKKRRLVSTHRHSSSRHRATRENGRRRMRPRRGQSPSPRGRLPRASWRDPVGRRGDGAYPLRIRGGARSAGGPLPRRANRRPDLDPSARPGPPPSVWPRNAVRPPHLYRRAHGTPYLSFSSRLCLSPVAQKGALKMAPGNANNMFTFEEKKNANACH